MTPIHVEHVGLRNPPMRSSKAHEGGGGKHIMVRLLGRHAALNVLTWFVCLIASYEGGRKEPSRSGDILSPLLRGSAKLNGDILHF